MSPYYIPLDSLTKSSLLGAMPSGMSFKPSETELVSAYSMKKQTFLLFDAAKKAAQTANQEHSCVALLNRVRSSPITTRDLFSTSIGREVVLLTHHPSPSIQAAAASLLDDWVRKMYRDGGCKESIKEPSITSRPAPATRTKIAARVKSMKRVKKVVVGRAATAPVSKKVGACSSDHQETVRSKIRFRLAEALSKVVHEVGNKDVAARCDPDTVGALLESVLFRNLGPVTGAKKFKWQSILFNLRDPTNPDFRRKILLGEVQPERVAGMDAEEMASNQRRLQNEQVRQRILSKIGIIKT